jgi:hypothetical protein
MRPRATSCNLVRPRAIPCNFVHLYVPQKKKGAIKIECSFKLLEGDYLKGKSCNFVQFDAPSCNPVHSCATKIPKRTFFPIFEYAFLPLGMGFTQPSWHMYTRNSQSMIP